MAPTTDPWTTGVTVDTAGNTTVSYPLGTLGTTSAGGGAAGANWHYYPPNQWTIPTSTSVPQGSTSLSPMLVTDAALNEDGLILDAGGLKVLVPKALLKRLAILTTMAQLAGLVEADDAAR